MKNKKILVLYQDWSNFFEENISVFEHWFKNLDGAYLENNDYYIFSISLNEKKFQLEKNIKVELFKTSPKKQILDFFKIEQRLNNLILEYEPDYIYVPYLYMGSMLPKKNSSKKYKVISFLRDKTPKMIQGKGGIRHLIGYLFYLFDYLAFKKTDKLLYNGKSLLTYSRSLGYKGKAIFCPRDISDKKEFQKSKLETVDIENFKNKKVILSVARLSKSKNLELGIKALSYLDENYVYVIIGDGEDILFFKNLAKKLGVLHRVFFIGYIKHKDIWKYYKAADVFWLLSKTDFEGTPNVVQEAFYAKVPVIVSNVSSMKNIVKENKNGIILNSFKTEELVEKTKLLLSDKKLYKYFQVNGYKTINKIIKQRFEIKNVFK